MVALRASLTRQMKVIFAVLVAATIAMTSLVATAPSAGAAYKWHCVVSKTIVHRRGTDAALCRHGIPFHRGHAFVLLPRRHGQKHRHHLILKVFRTGHNGNALFGFRIKPRTPLGRTRVYVVCGNKRTSFVLVVKRARHHRRHHHRRHHHH